MTNHIHVVAVPQRQDALEKVFRPLPTRYAQRINRAKKWKGHLWQGRFFSSALDETYLWAAIRYVKRNPVRARMARRAQNYKWSSARGTLWVEGGRGAHNGPCVGGSNKICWRLVGVARGRGSAGASGGLAPACGAGVAVWGGGVHPQAGAASGADATDARARAAEESRAQGIENVCVPFTSS